MVGESKIEGVIPRKKFRFQFPQISIGISFPLSSPNFLQEFFPNFGWLESALNLPGVISLTTKMHIFREHEVTQALMTFIYALGFCNIFKRNSNGTWTYWDKLVTLSLSFLPQWWTPLSMITKNKQRQAGDWRRTSNLKEEHRNERLHFLTSHMIIPLILTSSPESSRCQDH